MNHNPSGHASNQQKVLDWRRKFLFPCYSENSPTVSPRSMRNEIDFQFGLIKEEYEELFDSVTTLAGHGHPEAIPCYSTSEQLAKDLAAVAKEAADLLFTVYGLTALLGIDLDKVFDLVCASNSSKVDDKGNPIFNENGKAMKGPNYKPPALEGCIPDFS